jgi:hypothetical protein
VDGNVLTDAHALYWYSGYAESEVSGICTELDIARVREMFRNATFSALPRNKHKSLYARVKGVDRLVWVPLAQPNKAERGSGE